MLSPHEFAVLLLVNDEDGAESREFNRADVQALIEHQLVTLERRGPDHCYAHVTLQGYRFLKASGHARASRRKAMSVVH
ncbi:hypothetical protein ACQUJS_21920 [Ralstonia pseudosolanacearum]|uniref:Uncharacterized protein n=1 Tax=Ralstonia solanacearum TaxID=305 RepID=A0AA92IGH7_RALSL|nr:hypothetical protein [Ralstonia pseudosolanacearum]QCX51454.1 hypothetical protein E7Z57_20625 [Ralstonia pseudosolanacearum]